MVDKEAKQSAPLKGNITSSVSDSNPELLCLLLASWLLNLLAS